jgi:hypothetical protein
MSPSGMECSKMCNLKSEHSYVKHNDNNNNIKIRTVFCATGDMVTTVR